MPENAGQNGRERRRGTTDIEEWAAVQTATMQGESEDPNSSRRQGFQEEGERIQEENHELFSGNEEEWTNVRRVRAREGLEPPRAGGICEGSWNQYRAEEELPNVPMPLDYNGGRRRSTIGSSSAWRWRGEAGLHPEQVPDHFGCGSGGGLGNSSCEDFFFDAPVQAPEGPGRPRRRSTGYVGRPPARSPRTGPGGWGGGPSRRREMEDSARLLHRETEGRNSAVWGGVAAAEAVGGGSATFEPSASENLNTITPCPHRDGVQSEIQNGHLENPIRQNPCPASLEALGGISRNRKRGPKLLKTGNWSNDQLKAAMDAIERGCPINTAATDFDIPRSTLRNHVMGLSLSRKRGRKPVLKPVEEEKIVKYIMGMASYGHPINITMLKVKVAEATQLRMTPFKEGIPGQGWLRWFRKRHPEITVRMSQGLDAGRAKGLCPRNVATFYENLRIMLDRGYESSHIWNCDESGAQAGRNGGGRVLARKGVRSVHSIIPKEREWLSVLCCVNAAGYRIPSFYIFRGKKFKRDYIKGCEANASMGMQAKAWMTGHLFKAWIGHFVKNVNQCGLGISPSNRHLLILDGHGSHVTMDVVKTACTVGLDLLTIPSHTSHEMQPLDVSCFKPFKQAFRLLRDVWTLRNKSRGAGKEVLASWVSKALEKGLSASNIKSGFRTTGIFPFNPDAMNGKMGPSDYYREVPVSETVDLAAIHNTPPDSFHVSSVPLELHTAGDQPRTVHLPRGPSSTPVGSSDEEESDYVSDEDGDYAQQLETALAQPENAQQLSLVHFYVPPEQCDDRSEEDDEADEVLEQREGDDDIDRFLVLPQEDVPVHAPLPRLQEPHVDYSVSHILTSDDYLARLVAKAAKKEALIEEAKARKVAAEDNKEKRQTEKADREAKARARANERAANKRLHDYWDKVKRDGWGDKLHAAIKASTLNPVSYASPHRGLSISRAYKYNQKIAQLRRQFKKQGRDPRLVAPLRSVSVLQENAWYNGAPFANPQSWSINTGETQPAALDQRLGHEGVAAEWAGPRAAVR